MKINTKYLSIAIYALGVIVVGTLLVMLIFAARDYLSNRKYEVLFAVLQPFLYGFVLAYILNPLMVFYETKVFYRVTKTIAAPKADKRLKRMLSVFATITTTVVVVGLLSVTVYPQISKSVQQLSERIAELFSPIETDAHMGDLTVSDPAYIYYELMNRKIGLYINDAAAFIQAYLNRFGIKVDIEASVKELFLSAVARVTVFFNEYSQAILNATTNFIVATVRQVFNVLLAIIAAFYMLAGKERLVYQVKRLLFTFLPLIVANKAVDVTRKSHRIFSGFFRGKLLESLIVGVICFICMTLFSIEYQLLISLIIGITNIIPFFGPIIGAIPSIFFLLLHEPTQALWFSVFILVLQQLDGNFIGPKIIGDTMGLSPFWIIFAIMVMTGLMGIPGMFIGVPLFGVIYALVKEFSAWRLSRKGVLPSVISPIAQPPEVPTAEENENISVAKVSSLVESLAKNIQKYIHADGDKK